jgi:pimeloyl-ACP methyl ester carboxylesterase
MSSVLTRHRRGSLSYLRGGSGPSLVLLHGLPGSAHTWARAATLLAAHYDVILPDLSGFGASDDLAEELYLDHDLYLEAHADAVHRLLDELDISSFFLGGHDFGGTVAVALQRLFPDLTVCGLALSASLLVPDAPLPLPLRLAGTPVVGPMGLWFATGTRLGLRLLYRLAVQNRTTFRRVDFERHLTPSALRQTHRLFRHRLTQHSAPSADTTALLPQLDLPTIALWGDHDPFFPVRTARRLVRTLPNATLSLFEDTGHFVPEERPEMTAWHIDDFFRAQAPSEETPSNHQRSSL